MKQKLLLKALVLFTIFLLMGLGLNPIVSSKTTIEQKQIINDTKSFSLNEKELCLLKNYISNILTEKISDTLIEKIIKTIKNMIYTNPSLLNKDIVISQGWGYNTNLFKNTRFQIKHEALSFWHYTQASKHGIESKTFVIRANDATSPRTIELYRGIQTGLMVRSIGLYFFQKNTFPTLSYTLFIGFAGNVFVTAEEVIEIPFPLP